MYFINKCYLLRTPIFTEELIGGEGIEGELVQPIERSFWAKYVSMQHTCCWFDRKASFILFYCLIKLYIHTNFSVWAFLNISGCT